MDDLLNRITDAVEEKYFCEMEASGRHVHLSKADAMTLFGRGLTKKAPLSQPGQYVCAERVALEGPKGTLERVAVLGPEREESQVEVSLTDAVILGIRPPIRLSGDTKDSAGLTVIGEKGRLELKSGVIAAMRHIHMTPADAARHGLKNGDSISIRAATVRPVTFENVAVRVSDKFTTRVHLDYDEANACDFHKGDLGMLLNG